MSSPAYELAQYLAAQNVGEFGGDGDWSIFVASEPTTPESCITVYDEGDGDEYFQPIDLDTGGVQVRVRSFSYEMAYEVQKQSRQVLTAIGNEVIQQHYYIGVWAASGIMSIGRDDNERFLLVCNYRVERQSSDGVT